MRIRFSVHTPVISRRSCSLAARGSVAAYGDGLLIFGLATETSQQRRRSERNGRRLWRRFLNHGFLLRRRRLLHPLLLARRGTALCLLGFLRHGRPPDRFNQNYANMAPHRSPLSPSLIALNSLLLSRMRSCAPLAPAPPRAPPDDIAVVDYPQHVATSRSGSLKIKTTIAIYDA